MHVKPYIHSNPNERTRSRVVPVGEGTMRILSEHHAEKRIQKKPARNTCLYQRRRRWWSSRTLKFKNKFKKRKKCSLSACARWCLKLEATYRKTCVLKEDPSTGLENDGVRLVKRRPPHMVERTSLLNPNCQTILLALNQ